MKKKYLSEIMKGQKLKNNAMIVAPPGSGKTHYILNDLCKDKKALYLCDNSNLTSQTLKEHRTHRLDEAVRGVSFGDDGVTVMTYMKFAVSLFNREIDIDEFEVVICDEVHNLIDYQGMDDNKYLFLAINELFREHETKIYYFTATPFNVDKFFEKHPNVGLKIEPLDFTNNKEIMQYVALSVVDFTSYKQVPTILNRNRLAIDKYGYKTLVYTRNISTMIEIERDLSCNDYTTICIWSEHNEEYPMSEEQLRVKNHLLSTGELLAPYDVLIINRATETGVNITDERMMYCVINTTNVTEQIQARGRIRHDIIELRLKKKHTNVYNNIKLGVQWLDTYLTKVDKDALVEELNMFDNFNRPMKWNAIKNLLIKQGYRIYDKSVRIEGKKTRVTMILEP